MGKKIADCEKETSHWIHVTVARSITLQQDPSRLCKGGPTVTDFLFGKDSCMVK